MTSALRGLVWILFSATCAIAQAGGPEQTNLDLPPDCKTAGQMGYTISKVTVNDAPPKIKLPVKGEKVSLAELDQLSKTISVALENLIAEDEGDYRFRYKGVSIDCTADSRDQSVEIRIDVDRLDISEGDSLGAAIDEADPERLNHTKYLSNIALGWDRNPRLGHVLTLDLSSWYQDSKSSNSEPSWFEFSVSGRKSASGPFYYAGLTGDFTELNQTNPRARHLIGAIQLWTQKVPIAESTISAKGLRYAFGYQLQSGRADVRWDAAYRYSKTSLNGAESYASHQRHNVETSLNQEFQLTGGFLRLGSWLDAGRGLRYGAFTRLYQNINVPAASSISFELSLLGGNSLGSLPADRRFAGGDRLDPFLGEKSPNPSELTSVGPILRGFGISEFYVPRRVFGTVAPNRFAGVSLTLGVPGISTPLIKSVDLEQSQQVRTEIQRVFDQAVVSLVQRNLDLGVSGEKAAKRSKREAMALRRTLQNLLQHGHKFSARPLLFFDGGWITDDSFNRTAATVGGGVRIQRLGQGIDVLYTRVVHDTLPEALHKREILIRLYLRHGF